MNTAAQYLADRRAIGWIVAALLAGLLLAGCGGAPASSTPHESTPTLEIPVAAAATDAPARAPVVAATVTPAVAATEPLAPPAPAPTTAGVAAAPAASACTVVSNGLRLRNGPGEVYNPPIAALATGTALRPLAFSPTGYPSGQWIAVQTLPGGQIGWVNAAPAFVSCTMQLASLPAGSPPPTPAPAPPPAPAAPVAPAPTAQQPTTAPPTRRAPSPTPPVLAARPPDGEVQVNIVDPQDGDTITDQLTFEAEAVRVGLPKQGNGTGIDRVDMSILDAGGQTVYKRTENNARYCAFGGGEPDCTVWVFAAHGNKWPNGKAIQPGTYTLRAIGYSIYPKYDKPKKAEIEVQINPAP